MLTCFYDIESFDNAFTLCNFIPHEDAIDLFYLVDTPDLISEPDFLEKLSAKIYKENKNFTGQIRCYDLKDRASAELLAKTFGLSNARMVNDPSSTSDFPAEFRPVCDTDPNYDDEIHPFLMGYNSYNYDTTMLAFYFFETFPLVDKQVTFAPPTAETMRRYNNSLFLPMFKSNMPSRLEYDLNPSTRDWKKLSRWESIPSQIRRCMLLSGRHVDVARLNEKQQHVGLKRLIGMMGGQILESEKLSHNQSRIDNAEQFYDLMAYNVSDCVNLKYYIFEDRKKLYSGNFNLKRQLLKTYPELIYKKKPNEYAPDIRPEAVRFDRLYVDSSSAQLATKSLCPYGHLTDIPVVSFLYPSERKAKELGVPRVNVLEEAKKFFYDNFPQPEIRAEFDRIYTFYKTIEGKNFNESQNYQDDYEPTPDNLPENIRRFSKANTCLYYYNADGTPSTCFVTFSIGGIHGAEYNRELFEAHLRAFEEQKSLFDQVQAAFPDPLGLKLAKTVTLTMPDGTQQEFKASYFLRSGSTKKKAEYKDIEKQRPVLFQENSKGAWELNKKYVYTSADLTNHEDFTSYYPNLLRMLSAFHNDGLGYDRYAEIFQQKQDLGKVMKDKSLSKEERDMAAVQREGTKLILNSASGAADANFESNIRMNNVIISMRIIGQLFSWRIGQAQTLAGARITSTNTDGLFSVLEAILNNEVLERESAEINVEIEPEPTYLISKDSNNRIEVDDQTGSIQRASGGSLACHKGPTPDKSLAHPAIIDWALCEYLVFSAMRPDRDLSQPFDESVGRNIFKAAPNHFNKTMLLNMYQNVIASSLGTDAYNFAVKPGKTDMPIPLQHYNRVFIMKDKTPKTFHLYCAAARKITPATAAKRAKNGERQQQHDQTAIRILTANGLLPGEIPSDKEAVVKKITGIEPGWYMLVMNRALSDLTEAEQDEILDNLDYEKYLGLLKSAYENNWRNTIPGSPEPEASSDADDDAPVTVIEDEPCDEAETVEPETEPIATPEPSHAELMQMAARQEIAAAPIPDDLKQTEPQVPDVDENQQPFEPDAVEQPAPEAQNNVQKEPYIVPKEQNIVPNNADIVPQNSSTASNPVIPPLAPPEVMDWLQSVPSWPADNPFPITDLDSNDYDELMRAGFQRMREAYALFTKAYEIKH